MLINVKRKNPITRPTLSTAKIRNALQSLVDGQVSNVDGWLREVAGGIPKVDAEGQPLRDAAGSIVWVNKPDPATAVKLIGDLAEFIIPKLSRSDVSMVGKVEHQHLEPGQMNAEQLQAELLRSLGIVQQPIEGEIIDVEAVPVRTDADETPDWLR